jgi:hypothetical protein
MPKNKSRTTIREWLHSVRHGLDANRELREEVDVTALSVIGEVDAGVNGAHHEVLVAFQRLLEPTLASIESDLTDPAGAGRLLLAAQRLKRAAVEIGALRLAAACDAVERHLTSRPARAVNLDIELRSLVGKEITEIIRVQRRLRTLLQ